MGTGYTRNDTANNIADGNIINASDLDGEFDAVQSAFDASTGHTHDGTAGEGAPIETIGPTQDVVATASVLRPKTPNTVDLGTSTLEYKDLFLDGTAHIDTLDVDENASITGTLGVTGATTLSSTLGVTGATTLSSTLGVTGAVTLSSTLGVTGAATLSSTLAVTGATGIDGDFDINTNKFTVASTTGNTAVAGTLGVTGATTLSSTLGVTGTTTLGTANITTGTITTADINGGNIDGTIIGATTAAAITGTTITGTSFVTSGDMTFGDNDKAIFGAGSDLQIYHDSTLGTSRIQDVGTGSLYIQGDGGVVITNSTGTSTSATFASTGATSLSYNGTTKFATTGTGVDITGTLTSDGLTVDGLVKSDTASNGFRVLKGSSTYYGELSVDYISNDVFTYVDSIAGASYNGSVKIRTANNGGSVTDRVRISSSGVSFYEDTGTTAKFFWDASAESLGIGTSSPTQALHVNAGTTNEVARFESTDGTAYLSIMDSATSNSLQGIGSAGDNLTFYANNGERMRIDSSGNVGIGTSSPATPLHIVTSGNTAATFHSTTDNSNIVFTDASTTANVAIGAVSGNNFRVQVNNAERMRIDSSGNLLVGQTAANSNAVGIGALPYGSLYSCRDGGAPFLVNRKTSDGDIALFQKDGSTVGSIGANSSNAYISGTTRGLHFTGPAGIIPCNEAGAARDADTNLGTSSTRFKDLYLSGGVYLGGTGSANHLDDYEEGTWTAEFNIPSGSVTYNNNSGVYTKVGNIVHVSAWIYISALSSPSGTLTITMPFTNQGNVRQGQVFVQNRWTGITGLLGGWMSNSSDILNLVQIEDGTAGSAVTGSNFLANGELYINYSYQV
jgi:hypothetical protein